MKVLIILLFAFLCACGGGGGSQPQPRPTQQPTEVPVEQPTTQPTTQPATQPTPVSRATPYPIPPIDTASYLPPIKEGFIAVISGDDLGRKIQAAQNRDDVSQVVIEGGGIIDQQIILKKHTVFKDGDYTPNVPWDSLLDTGLFLMHGNIRIEFGPTAKIWSPDYQIKGVQATIIFQALGAHEGKAENIALLNPRIHGRNLENYTYKDAGVRQTISLGNCHNCAVFDADLKDLPSIGIQFGGSARIGNHAIHGLVHGGKFEHIAAAAIAGVNVRDFTVWNPTVLRPGHHNGPGCPDPFNVKCPPGGVSGVDFETNNTDDDCADVRILNGRFDYSGAGQSGSAILAQNTRHVPRCTGLLIANNHATYTLQQSGGTLTSGIFGTGPFKGGIVVNNYIQRSVGAGVQWWGATEILFQDIELVSVGGGGLPAIHLIGGGNNIFRRVNIRINTSLGGSTSEEIRQEKSEGNVFE